MITLLGIFWIAAAAGCQTDDPHELSDPPVATTPAPDEPAPSASDPRREALSSLSLDWSHQAAQDSSICFFSDSKEPTSAAGAPNVHSEGLFQVGGRMDTADRRGLGARAEFCNRRLDLSASQPATAGPTPVPGPGSVGVFVSAALVLLRRRRE